MIDSAYETDRLILRNWQESDTDPFVQMNLDPTVMEFFPELKTRQESEDIIEVLIAQIIEHGFGFWAVERKDTNQFIGSVGLSKFTLDLPFCPCVEIGWRLVKAQWGHGFATEAARKCLEIGFRQLDPPEIYSFTTLKNLRSQKIMTKIGMFNTNSNFLHPTVPKESGLQEHCLYKITKEQWITVQP